MKIIGFFFCVVGCTSESGVRNLPPAGLEDAVTDAGLGENPSPALLHGVFEQASAWSVDEDHEGEPSDEGTPLEPGEVCDNTFMVWNGAFNPEQWQEVSAFPLFSFLSESSYDIAQGDSASLFISITAMCGPIELEHSFLVVDQDVGAGWNVGPYEEGAEMELRDPIADVTLGSGASNTLSWAPAADELHYLSYSENSGVIGGTISIDPIYIPEGETQVLQYRFGGDFTGMVPVGSRFGLSTDIWGWKDVNTSTYIQLGGAYPWAVPAGGLAPQGAELPYMGPGTVFNIVQ